MVSRPSCRRSPPQRAGDMARNPCRGWQHGDPVTLEGAGRREISRGTVAVRRAKAGHHYIQVTVSTRQNGGCYTWPEGWVLGQGRTVGACLECEQLYRTDARDPSGFCLACDRSFENEAAADSGICRPMAYMHGARTPLPKGSPEQLDRLAAIAKQKAADENDSPF